MDIVNPAIERYLTQLEEEPDAIRAEMEQLGRERGFPFIGPHVGRLLGVLARGVSARRMIELGSGFGYSAWWLAGALPPGGELHCTDASEQHRDEAVDFLGRAGLLDRVRFHVGDALEIMERLGGPWDLVLNDIDKESYPDVVEPAVRQLRRGGLLVTDNVLWKGKVALDEPPDELTRAVLRYNRVVAQHDQLETVILPLRDGVAISIKL